MKLSCEICGERFASEPIWVSVSLLNGAECYASKAFCDECWLDAPLTEEEQEVFDSVDEESEGEPW